MDELFVKEGNSAKMSDAEADNLLLKMIMKGSQEALDLLFNRYYKFLCKQIHFYIDNIEDAEEIASDIFMKLWEKKTELVIEKSLKDYFYITGKHRALNFLRVKKLSFVELDPGYHDREASGSSIKPDGNLNLLDTEKEVLLLVDELPAKRKQIFKLHKLQGYSPAEIASMLNLSTKTVSNQIERSMRYIRENFKSLT